MQVTPPQEAKEERVGFNSLRDFFLDEWKGQVVSSMDEITVAINKLLDTMTVKTLTSRLKETHVYVCFAKGLQIGYAVTLDIPTDLPIKFRIVPVEKDLNLVYFYLNRNVPNIDSKIIAAELEGLDRLARRVKLPKPYARLWLSCRNPDRITCLPEIKYILENEKYQEAFLYYNQHFNYKEYSAWQQEYGFNLKIRKGHRHLLSKIIKTMLSNRKKKPA